MKKHSLQVLLVAGFLLAILMPGAVMLSSALQLSSDGSEHFEEALPDQRRFSRTLWLSKEYQHYFDSYFAGRFPGRERFVEARKAIKSAMVLAERRVSASQTTAELSGPKGEVIKTLMAERERFAEPEYPEYARKIPLMLERNRSRQADDIVVGKDGMLFIDSYINEVFGFAPRYTDVTDEKLRERANELRYIQDELHKRNIAFTVLVTPSKAAQYVDYLPDWYLAEHSTPEGYVRPYTRFLAMLEAAGVEHIDSATVFREHGIANSFPTEGAHWTALAALPVMQKLVDSYGRQSGKQTRQVRITGFDHTTGYRGRELELRDAFNSRVDEEHRLVPIDPAFTYPRLEPVDASLPAIEGVWMQGGDFIREVESWLKTENLATDIRMELGAPADLDVPAVLENTSLVVFETNEQFVYNMGGPEQPFGKRDFEPVPDKLPNVPHTMYLRLGGDDPELLAGPFRLDVPRAIRDTPQPEERFPEYDRANVPTPSTPPPWEDSTRRVVVGKDGMLFESATINEFYGLTPKYRRVTDAALQKRAEQLAAIEQALGKRGIAFALLITPSKASQYPENIPQWYLNQFTIPRNYARPYARFLPMLKEQGVSFIDSASLLNERGISNTFTHSGSSWNLIASLEASKALIAMIEKQKGISALHLRSTGVRGTKERVTFSVDGQEYDHDQDLLALLYPEASAKRAAAADPLYYKPEVTVTNMKGTKIGALRIQGGVFMDELLYWLAEHEIALETNTYLYNTWDEDWDGLLNNQNGESVDCLVVEVNEQDIFNIGGSQPGVGRKDAKEPPADEYNFIEALHQYLTGDDE